MAKLYPPVISGTIPAFCGTSIEVPFSMSRAVSEKEVGGLVLKIKKINGTVLGTITISGCPNPASFSVAGLGLALGEYYKVQLAYVDILTKEIGIFSTIGVTKYTSKPYIGIEGLERLKTNNHNYIYTGIYRQADGTNTNGYDTSEKLYSSRFFLYDDKYNLIHDTGEMLHNANGDVSPYEATDVFEYHEDFDLDKSYYLEYKVITSNGMEVITPKYKLSQRRLRPMILNAHLEVKNNFETGTVSVNLVQDTQELASGSFLLSRASSRNPSQWEPMKYFALQSEYPNCLLYTDYTVEQGISYTYALQQYNDHNVYSERRYSNTVTADFEDLFLYDGERQLAVRFNPKVATFKENRVEQKTETIGNKYPFIIKNGAVSYKELSISGLISYQMDVLEQFMSKDELELPYNRHDNKRYDMRDLITDNLRAERIFKTEVLAWLNNGGIKLYRSPTEGNFIVRLMNVTTSPTDSLGRLLHTFNCVAYEMAESTYESLTSFGIIEPAITTPQTMRWRTVELREAALKNKESDNPLDKIQLNFGTNLGIETEVSVYTINFEGLAPGSLFYVGKSPSDYTTIYIGATGSYQFVTEEPYQYIAIPAKNALTEKFIDYSGSLTFGYKGWVKSSFDLIVDVDIQDQAGQRFVGNAYQSLNDQDNIMDFLTTIKDSVLITKYIKLYPREIKPLYYDEANKLYYLTENDEAHGGKPYTKDTLFDALDLLSLYKLYKVRTTYYDVNNEGYYLDKSYKETPEYIINNRYYAYIDPAHYYWCYINGCLDYDFTEKIIRSVSDMELYNVSINNDTINMYDVFSTTHRGVNEIDYLSIGPGVIMDMGYQMQTSTYNFETEDPVFRTLKSEVEKLFSEYIKKQQAIDGVTSKDIVEAFREYKIHKHFYLNRLRDKVQSYKEENNLNE